MPKSLTTEQIYEDASFFFSTLKDVHPELHFRTDQNKLDALEKSILNSLDELTNEEELIDSLNTFILAIGDDHSRIKYRPTKKMTSHLVTKRISNAVVIVGFHELDSIEKTPFQIGDRILALNGTPVSEVIAELANQRTYNNLDWALSLAARNIFDWSDKDEVDVTFSSVKGEVSNATLTLLDSKIIKNNDQKNRLLNPFEYNINHELNTSVLTYRACTDRERFNNPKKIARLAELGVDLDEIPDFEATCWEMFQEIEDARIDNLIIDIRNNQGGSTNINELMYKYITRKKISSYQIKIKISEQLIKQYEWYRKKEVGNLYDSGKVELTYPYRSRLTEKQLENIPTFSGNVYLLVNESVLSSGEWLAAQMKFNNLAQLVGTPTGGGGSRPGDSLRFRFPNCNAELYVSHKIFLLPDDHNYPGIMPDYFVEQSVESFSAGKDYVLEYGYENLINGSKNT